MTLYVYETVITFDEEKMSEYISEQLGKHIHDIGRVEAETEYAWEDVEQVDNVTTEQLLEYINECYRLLEYRWLWKEDE